MQSGLMQVPSKRTNGKDEYDQPDEGFDGNLIYVRPGGKTEMWLALRLTG